jgi:D-alanine-D-alanine ligase
MNSNIKIVLLVGGSSTERIISKRSSKSIYEALVKLGFDVKLIDPAYGINQPNDVEKFFVEEDFYPVSEKNYIEAFNLDVFNNCDLVFIGLHGKWGEDGTVQSLLDMKGIKYTGSKMLSSAVTMDKILSKILFDKFNIPTPKWFSTSSKELSSEELLEQIKDKINFPLVVKPNDQGSTVGLSIVRNKEQLYDALKLASQYSDKILIEEFIEGRELTVGIVGDNVYPVLEIVPTHEIYDYECKYTSGMSQYIVPAEIDEEISEQLKKVSLLAFKALECEGYARLDYRLSRDNKFYLLEINTLPGMTSLSLLPKMAKATGVSFEELVNKIVKLSL